MPRPAQPAAAPGDATARTLDTVPGGSTVTVVGAYGDAALVRRLAELGLRRGESVRPLHRTAGGGRLVAVGDSRVALAREVLRAVTVADDVPAPDDGAPGTRP